MLSYGDHLKDIVKGSLPLNHNTGIDMLNYIKIKWGGDRIDFYNCCPFIENINSYEEAGHRISGRNALPKLLKMGVERK
ncbi:hypothetical protein CYPRO_2900 [Cyclonatronum proteinivorum]|uniref:Uncharacterized protein n=1 Tax=Cyclonatronum proteinivorum TaxID=1457365 RepID=A0A345UNT6_9BACT|nr:hypothetical protein CYPRO_2900 [Cyclonatronum proteinivorum]